MFNKKNTNIQISIKDGNAMKFDLIGFINFIESIIGIIDLLI